MELEIPDTETDGWTMVVARGEIDVATAAELREQLTDLLAEGHHQVVIDLEDVDFIDSTGLGVLVGAVRRARSAEGDVRLVCTNSRLLKVFDITGLDAVFTIATTVDEAVTAPVEQG